MHEVKDGKIQLSTGVVFKVVDVSPFAFNRVKAMMELERPSVPVVYIESKEREEPNPNDPDYVAATENFDLKLTEKLTDMIILLGSELDTVPEDFPNAQDERWTAKLEKLGINNIPSASEDQDGRYLAWVKLCAMRTFEDYSSLLVACSRSAGVTEEDVAEAASSFRGTKKR